MDDLISRQKAIDAIRASRMIYSGTWGKGLAMAEERLRELPSAQPEIIHCRDCRYSIDFYQDGCCYCKRPSKEMRYIEEGYGFYCAGADTRG